MEKTKELSLTEYARRRQTVVESLKEVIYSNDSKEDKKVHINDLIYHNPWLVNEKYESIAILELKYPMENDYTHSNNPILEMLEYVEKIEENAVNDKYGKQIKVNNHTQFYLYAVCDLTNSLKDVAETFDFSETSDKLGMYWYNRNFNAHIQLLSYDKIIVDVGKRNKILFDKLGI